MSEFPTDLEQLLLLAVIQIGEGAYGAAIQECLDKRAGRSLRLGSIYNTLLRLEERGLVRSSKGESLPVRGGKAKRIYQVTPDGIEVLRQARSIYERMWREAALEVK
jgi:PadR family transcriptional regulator PadR